MTTMKDVAEHAGVSTATVSFVINNTKPVAPATRARIEQSMADLGYQRNMVARALASRRTRIIALVYPALERRLGASSMQFVTSAAKAASDLDYHLVVWPVSNDGSELAELVGQGLVDGVVLMEVQLDDPRVAALQHSATPFALIGRTLDPTGLPHVDIDFTETVRVALDHLTNLGHRKIIFVTGTIDTTAFGAYGPWVRSSQAFLDQTAALGLDGVLVETEHTSHGGRELAHRLLADYPETTAVMIVDEHGSLGLLAELQTLEVRVPQDLSVVSLMTSAEMATLSNPALTVLESPGLQLGPLGVQALIRQLENEDPLPPELVPCRYVEGKSTGIARRRRLIQRR